MEIVSPLRTVSLKKNVVGEAPGQWALTFEVVGRCDDCSADERVDLTVQPPTSRSGYVGRAVKPIVHHRWAADVFVGDNHGNQLENGDQLDIEALVLTDDDLMIVEGRPKPPPPIRGRAIATVIVRGIP